MEKEKKNKDKCKEVKTEQNDTCCKEDVLSNDSCNCHGDVNENCNCGDNCECNNEYEDNCNCSDECHDSCECEHDNCCECNEELGSDETLGYLELAQRIQADFENYKRRNTNVASESFNNGVFAFAEKLLPALDSFKQAKELITDENASKGIDIIHSQLLKALESFGIKKIDSLGEKFDPEFHNAVLTDTDDSKEDEVILEVLQEGFATKDKVIRHSVVKINKK